MINQESRLFVKFWENLPRSFFEILKSSKFQKSELGKFIPNFPRKHVITSTNHLSYIFREFISWLTYSKIHEYFVQLKSSLSN